jgi:predicted kinase
VKLYIAGPMTGLPDYNLPAFAAATQQLQQAGYDAINPGHRGVIDGYTWQDYMRDGIRLLLDCDGIALLDNWSDSKGAALEVHIAHSLAMPVKYVDIWLNGDGE